MLHPDARPHFNHHESEDPVPPQGTLDRFLLRTEQTGWAVLYINSSISLCISSFYNENRSDIEGFSGSGQDLLSTQRRGAPVGGSVGAEGATHFLAQRKRGWPLSTPPEGFRRRWEGAA